jgi:phosphatidylglycerophosphatase A
LAISDGTRENLNLLMVATTFARAFKEVDAVISRGDDQRRRFFDTPFQFTQDIYNITASRDGGIEVTFKPKHEKVIKFSHADLERKAQSIVDQMTSAKAAGMTVVFYSGIIGSIPGKIEMAKKIMSTFVHHLEEHSTQTFIINPSEFYEPGMDADDLMYMWEIVQRSGLIDIWRFQTYEDILQAFQILKKKVPPEWVGKDATFSTGCTKEMKIAVDVQRSHPEMQIIGPSQEKFMRRDEYGIGKMFDRRFGVL